MKTLSGIILLTVLLLLNNPLEQERLEFDEVKTSFPIVKQYEKADYASRLDSMIVACPPNIQLSEGFELVALLALQYYPELMDLSIEFKYTNFNTTMACRPKGWTAFKRKDRAYRIYINKRKEFEGIYLHDVPFNAQVGVFGHELAHIVDYERRGRLGLIGRAIDYLAKSSKSAFEKEVDRITIERGLGWQCLDFVNYVHKDSKASDEYKAFKAEIYLEADEIADYMNELQIYQSE